jgi:hypothetical protein
MRNNLIIPILFALVLGLALVSLVSAMSPTSLLAQATASPSAQATTSPAAQATTGTGTPGATETPLPPPNRGCLACHVQVDPDGRFTLAWEAKDRTEAQGKEHPPLPPDATYEMCITCHDGKIALRFTSILHPAHSFSPVFTQEFRGNCFSCHELGDEGFTVLVEKQNVNDKGVIQPLPSGTPGTPSANQTPGASGTTTSAATSAAATTTATKAP